MNIIEPALIATNVMSLGLGNRVRFTLSCQAIAESERRKFYYYWPVGDSFGAKLTDLWEYSEAELSEPGPTPYLTQWSTAMTDLTPHRHDPVLSLVGSQAVKGFGSEESWETKFRSLRPAPRVEQLALSSLQKMDADFIGVQVRASKSSHVKTLELSPVEWFIERMLALRAERGGRTKFYLSCDDRTAEEMIRSVVPETFVLPKSEGYNTKDALIESVVDLVVLSKSNLLIGPHMSSFVYLAWVLSNKAQCFETSQGRRLGSNI